VTVAVSVVIVSYNDRDKLLVCLQALKEQTFAKEKTEIIVVDDGSTDGTAETVQGRFPEVQLISKNNSGADNSRNEGVKKATGEIIAFIDADCVAEPYWLESIERSLKKNSAQVVGGRIIHRGSFLTRVVGISDFGEFQELKEKFVHNLPTCNMSGKRNLFEQYPFHSELGIGGDVVFSNTIRKNGCRLLYDPSIVVEHRPKINMKEFWQRASRYGESFVLIRMIEPGLPYAPLVRHGIAGVVVATVGRTVLDWYRLFCWRKEMGIKIYEIVPTMLVLLFKRLLSLPGAFKAYRNKGMMAS
jgi:glycosyltransferase involved in cell wall biosynthesis